MIDTTVFPNRVYQETVLEPLFEGVKENYAGSMMAINKAHLVMLVEEGILPASDGQLLAVALDEIDNDYAAQNLTYSGQYEDYFFYVEAMLKEKLGDLGGALHTARSRNDMDHTMFKMSLRSYAKAMIGHLDDLTAALIEKAQSECATPIVAYTHGQPAQASTFGHYLASVIEVLQRDTARLRDARDVLNTCPMGAAAITTSGFPVNRHRMAALLGFNGIKLNSYGCIASVDYVTGLYSALRLVFLHLGRVVQDMAFWSAFEVGQLYVPNSLVQVSSIMPQKRNPVPIEHMRHLASMAAGQADAVIMTMHNTPNIDMNDSEGEVQAAGYRAFDTGQRMVKLLAAFLPACAINGERVQANGDAACVTITELADQMVRAEGVTFRQAHHVSGTTAKGVISAGKPLSAGFAEFRAAFEETLGRPCQMTKAEFMNAVSMEGFINVRDRPGGPAPAAMQAAFDSYLAEMSAGSEWSKARSAACAEARATLNSAFTALKEGN